MMMMIIRWWFTILHCDHWQAAAEIFSFCPHQRQTLVLILELFWFKMVQQVSELFIIFSSVLQLSQTVAWQPLQIMMVSLLHIRHFSFLFFTFFDDNRSEHTCTITMVTDFSKCGRKVLNFFSACEIREQWQIFHYFFFLWCVYKTLWSS